MKPNSLQNSNVKKVILALSETHWFKLYDNLSKLAEFLQQLFGVKTGTQNLSLIWISKVGEKDALKYQRGIRWGAAFRFLQNKIVEFFESSFFKEFGSSFRPHRRSLCYLRKL